MTEIRDNYCKVVEEAVIAIVGNSITEGEKDSLDELGKRLWTGIALYLTNNRFNSDVGEEILKRQKFFQPHFET